MKSRILNQEAQEHDSVSKDTLEAYRLEAVNNTQQYQKEANQQRDNRVVRKEIEDGDLVLRRIPQEKVGKLLPKWEGPFIAI